MPTIVLKWNKGATRQRSTTSLRIRASFLALLYIGAVHFAYVGYINPEFEYAHYIYLRFSDVALIWTYFWAWLPVLLYKNTRHPGQAVAALIYVLAYVPIQLILLFTVDQTYDVVGMAQAALAFSMGAIFLSARAYREFSAVQVSDFFGLDILMGILTIIATAILVYLNSAHMRFVSFADVYDLRFEAAAVGNDLVSAYLISWLSYCFVSYFYARGLVGKRRSFLAMGLAASVIIYMATGSKAAILLLPITYLLYKLWGSGGEFLIKFLLAMLSLITILVIVAPDDGWGLWVKSIVLVRVLGSTGWVAAKYFEYFGTYGHTYYTHVGPINAITGGYPFGDLALGQLIGIDYSGTRDANFNAGFWASDGFAALGILGILVITPFVAALLYFLNRSMIALPSRFSVTWLVGFLVALLNLPLSTALLSGGGIIIMLFAWQLPRQINKYFPRRGNGLTTEH